MTRDEIYALLHDFGNAYGELQAARKFSSNRARIARLERAADDALAALAPVAALMRPGEAVDAPPAVLVRAPGRGFDVLPRANPIDLAERSGADPTPVAAGADAAEFPHLANA